MRFKVDVDGTRRATVKIQTFRGMTFDRVAAALYLEAEAVMQDSKENYVPVRWGILRSTGHVKQPRLVGTMWHVEMAYGGPAAPYAIVVHERPKRRGGDWSRTHAGKRGTNKYLEKPFRRRGAELPQRVAAWVRALNPTSTMR